MDFILGIGTLLVVLLAMTLFLKFAPNGKVSLQALSGAACASFLPEAFLKYAIGGVFHSQYFIQLGDIAGSLSGVAVGILTCLKFGISPVFAVLTGLVLFDFKLLPAFIAAYFVAFGIKQLEKYVPEGLDLIVVILLSPAIAYGIASIVSPSVTAVLKQIGTAITAVGDNNPYALALVIGAIVPVVGMTPLSSMVFTSLLGLTGIPMAIGALGCMGSSFVNFVMFRKLRIGNAGKAFAVAVEPLTQIDTIAKYPIQLYGTNAIVGMVNGLFITYMGIVVNQPGMATPIAGPIVALGFNEVVPTVITIVVVAIISMILSFFIGTFISKKRPSLDINMPQVKQQTH
ncbi:PTS sugar transporter subunit IIC [Staphylococcus intermedius]|uniref:Perfringolysin O regulator protein n=1 Tax=Staphylococcus intermedius NCTC 11048 TaxID=1141106 RepID=A0A380G3X8_STAIN|nr:PTS sugar transporter subunit IIC [Staphylococcus intermedius]PCF63859.1 transcriptional regulator [Staphylococcus intermedius]PCF78574.1 transcriptional regulator [Staphylococcus intermedius]PCF79547.1 transcriptional regulator [Staphylococcus intermedius]PCF86718.1 transcriptional regulator [Staphylococcus intermedius]PCF89795.1 transcriptional regulator [Staphylococcus intermedius]